MQSFLAYRRFGEHVKNQYERDKERAAAIGHHSSQTWISSSNCSSATEISSPQRSGETYTADVEKAEVHNVIPLSQSVVGAVTSNPATQVTSPVQDGANVTLSREETAKSKDSMGTNLGTALTGIKVRGRTTREGGGKGKVFVVGYEGESDIMNPHNWSFGTRWGATLV